MDEEILNIALRNALAEIKNALTDINWSFILTENGTVISSEEDAIDPNMAKAASSFQSLAEKASVIGGLDNMLITGEKGKVCVSSINDLYLVAGLAKNADMVYFRTITGAVLPAVLKVVDSVSSASLTPTPFKPISPIPYQPEKPASPLPAISELRIEEEQQKEEAAEQEEYVEAEEPAELEPEEPEPEEPEPFEPFRSQRPEVTKELENVPSQQLIVDRFSGFMVKADQVQLDADILKRWSALLDIKEINEVDVETFSGKTARCKTKEISDSKLQGRGLIRIPEKACQLLDVRRGELVRVKPVIPTESD